MKHVWKPMLLINNYLRCSIKFAVFLEYTTTFYVCLLAFRSNQPSVTSIQAQRLLRPFYLHLLITRSVIDSILVYEPGSWFVNNISSHIDYAGDEPGCCLLYIVARGGNYNCSVYSSWDITGSTVFMYMGKS